MHYAFFKCGDYFSFTNITCITKIATKCGHLLEHDQNNNKSLNMMFIDVIDSKNKMKNTEYLRMRSEDSTKVE